MKINKQDKDIKPTPATGPNGTSGEFLSMHQVAKMTGYHQDYLGQMSRSGKLEAHKVGRNWFTTKLAVDKMLGRVPATPQPEKILAQTTVNPIVQEKTQTSKVADPTPQPVQVSSKAVTAEIVNVVAEEKIIVGDTAVSVVTEQELDVARPVMVRKAASTVKIKRLNISSDAGPNLQESLSAPQPEKNFAINIIGSENKNYYYRWQKIVGPEYRHKLEISRIKDDLAVMGKELEETKKLFLKKNQHPHKVETSSMRFQFAAGLASVCLAIAGTAYIVSDYFSKVTDSIISANMQNLQDQKRVAGESTDIYTSEMHWPPPYIELPSEIRQ